MAESNDKKRAKTLQWGYLFVIVAAILFVIFGVRIVYLQNNSNVDDIQRTIQANYRADTIKAARGNLYAADGSILATTVIKYNVFVDFKIIKDSVFDKKVGILSDSLHKMFGKTKQEFRSSLKQQKRRQNQYYTLALNLDFEQVNRLKRFPIFGKYNAKTKTYKKERCLIIEPKYKRILATNQIGAGTIGIDDERGKSGFEGAFSQYLSGKDGRRWVQRVNSKQWKPIDFW